MTNRFETTLTSIIIQESDFESLDERAVEIGIVLPLLRQVGWNTDNVSEIYPQRRLSDDSKVDYDLQIDGESRIVIEVKRWGHTLDDRDEDQLANYCRLAKPSFAVLTSGRYWRLYLPPTQHGLRRFLDFDITREHPNETERRFRQFLARDRMSDVKPTVTAARKLHRESQAYQKFEEELTEAWNELPNDKDRLTKLVLAFAENRGVPTSRENVTRFLESLHGPLVNAVPTVASRTRPASFALPASPTGRRKTTRHISRHNGWNNLLLDVCQLMQERHRESFRKEILSMTDRFAEAKDSNFEIPVGDMGIFARWGGSGEIRDACYEIVTRFGYPRDSLEIRDSNGAIL